MHEVQTLTSKELGHKTSGNPVGDSWPRMGGFTHTSGRVSSSQVCKSLPRDPATGTNILGDRPETEWQLDKTDTALRRRPEILQAMNQVCEALPKNSSWQSPQATTAVRSMTSPEKTHPPTSKIRSNTHSEWSPTRESTEMRDYHHSKRLGQSWY